jgi:hypothetical protein
VRFPHLHTFDYRTGERVWLDPRGSTATLLTLSRLKSALSQGSLAKLLEGKLRLLVERGVAGDSKKNEHLFQVFEITHVKNMERKLL